MKKEKLSVLQKLNVIAIMLPILLLSIMNTSKFLIVGILAFQALVILCNTKSHKKNIANPSHLSRNIVIFMVFFMIMTMLMSLFGSYASKTFITSLLIFGSIVIMMLLMVTDHDRAITIQNAFRLFVWIVILLCLYAIVLRFLGNQYIVSVDASGSNYVQSGTILGVHLTQSACGDPNFGFMVGSLTSNPNMLSYLVLFAFTIHIMTKTKHKKTYWMGNVILIIGMFISGSRLAMILMVLSFVFSILYRYKIYKSKLMPIMILGVLALFTFLMFGFDNLFQNIDLNGREFTWTAALKEISAFRLFGQGLGYNVIYLEEYFGQTISMHNTYLSLLIDYGIIPFVIFITFCIGTLISKLKAIDGNKYVAMSYVLFALLLIIGLSESTFLVYGSFNYIFFYVLFNLYIVYEEKKDVNNIHADI